MTKVYRVSLDFTGTHDVEVEAECSEEAEALAMDVMEEILFSNVPKIDQLIIESIDTEELEFDEETYKGMDRKFL